MEFDKSRFYTSVNADELKVGSKVVVADDIANLKEKVLNDEYRVLSAILSENCVSRFKVESHEGLGVSYSLAYLISEPEERKLKWQDVKVGYVLCRKSNLDVQPTVRDIADCIWDMSARDQVRLLSELNRVCFSDANAGNVQMHRMSEEINNVDRLPKIVRVSAKRFLDKMKDYLM